MDTANEYDYRELMKLSNQLCFPLYAAARKVTGLYTPFLHELHLTYTQYLVMLALWDHHKIRSAGVDPLSVKQIAATLQLDSATL